MSSSECAESWSQQTASVLCRPTVWSSIKNNFAPAHSLSTTEKGNRLLHHSLSPISQAVTLSPLPTHIPGLLSIKRYRRQIVPYCQNTESMNYIDASSCQPVPFQEIKTPTGLILEVSYLDQTPGNAGILRMQGSMKLWTFCDWSTDLDWKRWRFWTARAYEITEGGSNGKVVFIESCKATKTNFPQAQDICRHKPLHWAFLYGEEFHKDGVNGPNGDVQ